MYCPPVCTCSRCKEWDLQQDPARAGHNFCNDTNPGFSEACDTNKRACPSSSPVKKEYHPLCVRAIVVVPLLSVTLSRMPLQLYDLPFDMLEMIGEFYDDLAQREAASTLQAALQRHLLTRCEPGPPPHGAHQHARRRPRALLPVVS